MAARIQLPPTLLLLVSIALLALATPLVRFLVTRGGEFGIVATDAISFCNVLFVGNLCAGAVTFSVTGPRRLAQAAASQSAGRWAALGLVSLLSVVVPMLIFTALTTTTINNAVLLGRAEPVVFAALGAGLLGARFRRRQWLGYAIGTLGIAHLLGSGFDAPSARGDVLVLLASVLLALGSIASKRWLAGTDARLVVFVRNTTSAVVFFVIALVLFGPGHFADAFGAGLWLAMVAYAAVAVVLAQLAWYAALGRVSPAAAANASLLMPVLGMTYAFLLLGEVPDRAQWVAVAAILAGLGLSIIRVGTGPAMRGVSVEMELVGGVAADPDAREEAALDVR